jgi:hypothetical protein
MREKQFREDLFFRLNVVSITIPSLRQRPEAIPDLVRYFTARYGADWASKSPLSKARRCGFSRAKARPATSANSRTPPARRSCPPAATPKRPTRRAAAGPRPNGGGFHVAVVGWAPSVYSARR